MSFSSKAMTTGRFFWARYATFELLSIRFVALVSTQAEEMLVKGYFFRDLVVKVSADL
jgi:hypothetical protein